MYCDPSDLRSSHPFSDWSCPRVCSQCLQDSLSLVHNGLSSLSLVVSLLSSQPLLSPLPWSLSPLLCRLSVSLLQTCLSALMSVRRGYVRGRTSSTHATGPAGRVVPPRVSGYAASSVSGVWGTWECGMTEFAVFNAYQNTIHSMYILWAWHYVFTASLGLPRYQMLWNWRRPLCPFEYYHCTYRTKLCCAQMEQGNYPHSVVVCRHASLHTSIVLPDLSCLSYICRSIAEITIFKCPR